MSVVVNTQTPPRLCASTLASVTGARAVASIRDDLVWLHDQCTARRMLDAAKWAAEMLNGVEQCQSVVLNDAAVGVCTPAIHVNGRSDAARMDDGEQSTSHAKPVPHAYSSTLRLAISLIDSREFLRAHRLLDNAGATVSEDYYAAFLCFYAKYLAGEKRALDTLADIGERAGAGEQHTDSSSHTDQLRTTLTAYCLRAPDDIFTKYLYAHAAGASPAAARAAAMDVVRAAPAFWPAWALLARLCDSTPMAVESLDVPRNHWMYTLFVCECHVRNSGQRAADALDTLLALTDAEQSVLAHCYYVQSMLARAHKECKESVEAIEVYERMYQSDPYRLDDHDGYSSELFILSTNLDDEAGRYRVQLCRLAHTAHHVDPFRRETCIVLGNYYGKRNEHEMAIQHFERAIKLDPNNADGGVWTLIGHEFMELKNSAAACLSYRRALELDPADYRAWYGLGQMYDILRMPSHAVYYYNMAHKYRPCDSRMLVALGDMYTKLGKADRAQKCYWRAHCVGDIENLGILKLAKLFEKENRHDEAARCYLKYLEIIDEQMADGGGGNAHAHGVDEPEEDDGGGGVSNDAANGVIVHENAHIKLGAYRFLAEHALSRGELDAAQMYADECSDEPSVSSCTIVHACVWAQIREEIKILLKRIAMARMEAATKTTAGTKDANVQIA